MLSIHKNMSLSLSDVGITKMFTCMGGNTENQWRKNVDTKKRKRNVSNKITHIDYELA